MERSGVSSEVLSIKYRKNIIVWDDAPDDATLGDLKEYLHDLQIEWAVRTYCGLQNLYKHQFVYK